MSISTALSNEKGISLTEILVATVIISLAVLALGSLPISLGIVGTSRHESTAREVASRKMEDLRSQTYDNLGNGTSPITDSRLSSIPSGQGEITISDCPLTICTNGEEAKQVDIEISWTESGKTREFKTSSLISSGGLQ